MQPKVREPFFAIRAFNVEVASIKDGRHRSSTDDESSQLHVEKSSMAMHLRMEWWKSAISNMYNDTFSSTTSKDPSMSELMSHVISSQKQNPVVRSLHRAISEFNLTRRFLERLIESRDNDLDITQFQNIHELVQYSEDSVASLLYLNLECCNVRSPDADMIASNVGTGIGFITAIRSIIPRIALSAEVAIPRDLCEKYSITPKYLQDIFQNYDIDAATKSKEDENLQGAVKELCHIAHLHLSLARGQQHLVPMEGRLCLLPAVTALHYISALEKLDYNILHPDLLTNDGLQGRIYLLKNMLKLLRTKYTGVF